MIGYAERRDLVPPGTNLCSAVERFPEKSRERFLTSAELARLGDVLRTAGTNPRRRKKSKKGRSTWKDVHPNGILAIRLLAMTGMRLVGLQRIWEKVCAVEGVRMHAPGTPTPASGSR